MLKRAAGVVHDADDRSTASVKTAERLASSDFRLKLR